MKNILFDFLDDMPIKEIEKSMAVTTVGTKPSNGADFRLFSDGRIYPSDERIANDFLAFQQKDAAVTENGYDIFLATDWGQYPGKQNFVCIAKVSKKLPKVDLFATTRYHQDGTPKSDIKNYETLAPELIEMLEKVYLSVATEELGETLFKNTTYVDLKIQFNHPVKETSNKIYNIPKKIVRGSKVGQMSYERRENITIYPLSIVQVSAQTDQAPKDTLHQAAVELGQKNNNAVPADLAEKVFGA